MQSSFKLSIYGVWSPPLLDAHENRGWITRDYQSVAQFGSHSDPDPRIVIVIVRSYWLSVK